MAEEWNPGFYDRKGNFIQYDKSWYCDYNKMIHGSKGEYLNCKHCKSNHMHLKQIKHKRSMAESIDIQMADDIRRDASVCPTCGSELTTYWNDHQTHKYEVCINDEIHHKKLVDFVKDDD